MMPKHYNQYKVKSAAWKKAKKEHDEAVRKRKAVATRLMNIKTKSPAKKKTQVQRPKLGEGAYRQGTRPDDPRGADYKKRYIITPNMREKYGGNKKRPIVIVGEKQWQEYLKFSKRKRSDKQS